MCLTALSPRALAGAFAGSASTAPMTSMAHHTFRISLPPPSATGGSYAHLVPEGDTIHFAANRIRPVLEGHVPDALATPHPRFGRDRWPERLAGRAVTSVDAHGKHLFLRFEGDLVIHSHLRMTGAWRVRPREEPVPRAAWLVIERGDEAVLQLRGPVLEL